MKKITLTLAALFSSLCMVAQTYVLDETFADNGTYHNGISFSPQDALLVNNNYYLISSNQIGRINYNGEIDTTFGTDGFVSLPNTGGTYSIVGFKHINNFFYLYGTVTSNAGNQDIFVCKINETGTFDTTFGTNNFATIDFGAQESVSDFTLDATGNLYCIGTRNVVSENNSAPSLIYFKVSAAGALNTSFDTDGYKEILITQYSDGKRIITDGNNFLLVGTTTFYLEDTRSQNLLLSKVDTNGNMVTTFGTDGNKIVSLPEGGMTNTLKGVELADNNLYVTYTYAWSQATHSGKLLKYDLTTGLVAYNIYNFEYGDFQLSGSDIYTSGVYSCGVGQTSCDRKFALKKLPASTGVSTGSEFNYNFEDFVTEEEYAMVILKDETGKILLAGFNQVGNLLMLRLNEVPLGLEDVSKNNVTVYPNPFTDFVTVNTQSQIKDIRITDLSGRIISTPNFTAASNGATINLANTQQQGMYLMTVTTTDNKSFSKKIVKQ